MAVLPIVQGADNKILRTVSKPVKSISKKTLKFVKEMEKSMKKAKGVGIAAPQVGENIRIYLALIDNKKLMTMINPEIIEKSDEFEYGEEGCLSLPGVWGPVPRALSVTVKYLDEKGKEKTIKLSGFNAKIMQHEMDHLDGHLFIDRMDPADNVIMR